MWMEIPDESSQTAAAEKNTTQMLWVLVCKSQRKPKGEGCRILGAWVGFAVPQLFPLTMHFITLQSKFGACELDSAWRKLNWMLYSQQCKMHFHPKWNIRVWTAHSLNLTHGEGFSLRDQTKILPKVKIPSLIHATWTRDLQHPLVTFFWSASTKANGELVQETCYAEQAGILTAYLICMCGVIFLLLGQQDNSLRNLELLERPASTLQGWWIQFSSAGLCSPLKIAPWRYTTLSSSEDVLKL